MKKLIIVLAAIIMVSVYLYTKSYPDYSEKIKDDIVKKLVVNLKQDISRKNNFPMKSLDNDELKDIAEKSGCDVVKIENYMDEPENKMKKISCKNDMTIAYYYEISGYDAEATFNINYKWTDCEFNFKSSKDIKMDSVNCMTATKHTIFNERLIQ